MYRVAGYRRRVTRLRLARVTLLVAALGLASSGCLSGGRRRAEAESKPAAAAVAEAVAADLEAMVEGFPLHLNIAVRAVENARAARNEAEAQRLAALGRRERHPDARLQAAERGAAAALAEALALLESMDERMTAVEASLTDARAFVVDTKAAAGRGRGGLSRRDRNRLRRLHESAQADYHAITGAMVRLKGRWLLPHFEDDKLPPTTP